MFQEVDAALVALVKDEAIGDADVAIALDVPNRGGSGLRRGMSRLSRGGSSSGASTSHRELGHALRVRQMNWRTQGLLIRLMPTRGHADSQGIS